MNNVSRTRRGQYSLSAGLCAISGLALIALTVPAIANDAAGVRGINYAYPVLQIEDLEPFAETPANAQVRGGGVQAERDVTDRRGIKRALADSNVAPDTQTRKQLTREERRLLKRELRDAIEDANNGDSWID